MNPGAPVGASAPRVRHGLEAGGAIEKQGSFLIEYDPEPPTGVSIIVE
jgi:hypothetical protein